MGFRLSRIYTRTGDDGTTAVADGSRVSKDHARIEAIGAVDELNSVIGMLVAELPVDDEFHAPLLAIQHVLFNIGGELAMPGEQLVAAEAAAELEQQLDALNERLPPLENFVLPGGSRAAAICHQARSVCRRAERRLVALTRQAPVTEESRRYLNRLSDLLFVMARLLARRNGAQEVLWQQPPRPTEPSPDSA
ncbi:MAG: cob(I)yrinic acid a,c-diamide adenosyltransferase [Spongiibacteraceae bacterium]|jgi:cob(I)alamin adenosyltransferase|nr:cob(I)yrinic acid a,c-diamide adenosyltransferase [Spongiibacteraceae bacterium]